MSPAQPPVIMIISMMAVMVLAGCATFGARPALPRHEARSSGEPPLVYTESQDPCVSAINTGGLVRVRAGGTDGPIAFAELRRKQYLEPSIGGLMLSAATLFIFPAQYQRDRTEVQVGMVDRRTGRREGFIVERNTSTWGGLLLFPVTPFRLPASEARHAERSLCNELAIRMRQIADGFLVQ